MHPSISLHYSLVAVQELYSPSSLIPVLKSCASGKQPRIAQKQRLAKNRGNRAGQRGGQASRRGAETRGLRTRPANRSSPVFTFEF